MASSLYWIHHHTHTDMLSQGYVGVSNSVKQRWNRHKRGAGNAHLANAIKKYGWDSLVKKVIVIADEAYCLMIEAKLRAQDNIGWNITKGGGKPPSAYGNKNRLGIPPTNKGTGIIKKQMSLFKTAWNKGLETPENVKAKQSLAKIGKTSPRKGTQHSKESIEKMRLAKIGKKQSDEAIEKGRLKRLGKKQPLCTCPHCGKIGGAFTMPRWHFENCKEKE
jgi:predicted GIY-YIG superfamily endonuclease